MRMIIIYKNIKINKNNCMQKTIAFLLLIYPILSGAETALCGKAQNTNRIAVAGGSVTEILYALDLQHKIIALDTTSNYPLEAKTLPSIGYVRSLSTEGLLSLNPTLVLGENDMGPPNVLTQLIRTGIEIRIINEKHTSAGIIEKIECVGGILDEIEKSNYFVERTLNPQISKLDSLATKNNQVNLKVMFILNLQGGSPVVAGTGTSADGLIRMTGARNIMSAHQGWKQFSPESIVKAMPDAVVITQRALDSYGELEELYKHPVLSLTPAFRNQRVIVMDGMAMIGFGPRTITSAVQIASALNEIIN